MIVVSCDPGITSGYCVAELKGSLLEFVANEAKWQEADLWAFLHEASPSIIIYERFEFRQRARACVELFSRNLIGVINLYGQLNGTKLVPQQPAYAMQFFTDSKLQHYNCYIVGKEHARDATRHLLAYFKFGAGGKYEVRVSMK